MSDLNIAVVGAGIIGLTTAVELQKEFRNAKIHVIADKFYEDTVSFVAAGLFRPGTSFSGPTEEITRRWINDSYYYWDNLQSSTEGATAGVAQISGYIFSSEHPSIVRNKYLENLVPIYRNVTDEELHLCPGQWKYGRFFTTVLTQSTEYLPWVTKKFEASGGKLFHKKIENFNQLSNYDVILNCTGLGAKYLCNDDSLVPLRGQVLKVKAPWIKTFFYGDYDTYIIPGFNTVTLGGCRQYDSYDCSINKYDGLSIKERCENLVPSLKGAELVAQRVGLRPHRPIVRVEKEVKTTPNYSKLKIVHNYGHGGYGVTTAPGTSLYAVQLVKEILSGNSKL